MLVRLLPDQVPKLWESIKFTTSHTNTFKPEELPYYFNKLLISLLSNKAQCFARVDEERRLNAVMITRIVADEVTDIKTLFIESLYSFVKVDDQEWIDDFEIVKEFARKEKCKLISTYSNVERVWEILALIGLEERFRCFVKNFDGGE